LKTKINMKTVFLKESLPEDLGLRKILLDHLERLSIPIENKEKGDSELYYHDGQIFLNTTSMMEQGFSPLSFDFMSHILYHQRQNYSLKKEPLAKALGMKKNRRPYVLDATCGEGKDSLLMLHFGAVVKSYERNPIIGLLLLDALRRLKDDERAQANFKHDFEIIPCDSRHDSESISKNIPDVIYFDPMYPSKKKRTASPRKEMQIFEEVVGKDLDSLEFFEWAVSLKPERIVVKRSLYAEPLSKNPSFSIKGKSTRYDVYLC
jgi:16S rRNA (guanine1516-N2)-methyltransferase